MLLLIPKEPTVDSIQLAHVIAHELGHAKGLRHSDMKNVRYGWVDGWQEYFGWAADYPITAKPQPVQPTIADRKTQRLAHAREMLRRAATRARRAATIERKWNRRGAAF